MNALFSSIPNHAAPLSMNLLSNTILKSMASDKDFNIKMAIHPLSLSSISDDLVPNRALGLTVPLLFGVFLSIALAVFGACLIVFPVEEKLCKVRILKKDQL